jgi:hypothetical protein
MMSNIQTISAKEAGELIVRGEPLVNCRVEGTLDLYALESKLEGRVVIKNCVLDKLDSPSVEFKHAVELRGSHFRACCFDSAYFLAGLTIDSCVFERQVDFEAGGHNKAVISITNSEFREFANFFDCWFQGDVIIMNNDFMKGTNLLGNKGKAYGVSFDVEPRIGNNKGTIDIDG